MLGKLTHLAFDLVAISAILAGVRRSTGYTIRLGMFQDTSIRQFFESYLMLGETVFGAICGYAVSSTHFRRQIEDGK